MIANNRPRLLGHNPEGGDGVMADAAAADGPGAGDGDGDAAGCPQISERGLGVRRLGSRSTVSTSATSSSIGIGDPAREIAELHTLQGRGRQNISRLFRGASLFFNPPRVHYS